MNKKLLIIVGVAAVVGIGYYVWKSSKPKEGNNEGGSKLPKPCAADEYEKVVGSTKKCVKRRPKCAYNEVEQEQNGGIVCVKKHPPQLPIGGGSYDDNQTYEAYEAPTLDVIRPAFTGDTNTKKGSFFNPIRGRNQDTSF